MRLATWFIAMYLFLPGAALASGEGSYLIAAGNNIGLPDEQPLQYSEREAMLLTDVLRELGGISAQNAVTVLGESADNLRSIVLEVNARIRSERRDGSDQSMLIVYYSGHADARGLHMGDSVLSFSDLKAMMAGSPATIRILIIDACRSGGLTRVKGAAPAVPFEIQMLEQQDAEGMVIITSAAAGEDSYESDKLRSSFFSHHLVNALRGAADRDQDRAVTIDEAYRYAYQQTLTSSGRTWRLQHPTYHYDIKGKGKLVLTRLTDDRHRSGILVIPDPGLYLLIGGERDRPEVREVSVTKDGSRLLLPPGQYFVQKRARKHYLEYEFTLRPNAEVDLATLDTRVLKYAKLARKGGGDRTVIWGMQVLGAARGEIIDDLGVTPHLVLGITTDLAWLSFGLRGRFTQKRQLLSDEILEITHAEYGLGLIAQRFIDLRFISFAFGVIVEGAYHRQSFQTMGRAADRRSFGFGFGGLLTAEVEIIPEMVVVVEGGPMTQVLRRSVIEDSVDTGEETTTQLTWWVAGGMGWKF